MRSHCKQKWNVQTEVSHWLAKLFTNVQRTDINPFIGVSAWKSSDRVLKLNISVCRNVYVHKGRCQMEFTPRWFGKNHKEKPSTV